MLDRRGGRRVLGTGALLLLTVLGSALLFRLEYRYDNKYTAWRPQARNGVMWLEQEELWGKEDLLLHLVDGWEVYRDRLLEPEELENHIPDHYLFLGQYSGLNFGDRSSSTYGDATYRTTILTDGIPRVYGMELPEIYSAYRLWINGVPMGGMGGVGEEYRPGLGGSYLAFAGEGSIEIVLQVSDRDGYYSGMIYPPAFGSPEAVQRTLAARMLVHAGAWAIALMLGLFCLIPWQGWGEGGDRQLLLALFSLFFILYTGYPLAHGWGLTGNLWYGVERSARQLMTVCMLLLTGELCGVSRRLTALAAVAGSAVALLVLYPQVFPGWGMGGFYLTSLVLRYWHRVAALLLLGFGLWGLWTRRVRSAGLLAGGLVFACATLMDQLYRYHEPIVGGFFAETAGFLILLIIAGVLRWDAWIALRERLALREHRSLLLARIDAQVKAAEAERAYLEQVHTMRHEMEGQLLILQGYLAENRAGDASGHLEQLLGSAGKERQPVEYTGNRLVDDVLTARLGEARRLQAQVSWRASPLPETLPISDRDLMTVLLNLLNNALEALEQVEPPGERTLDFRLEYGSGLLLLSCANTCVQRPETADGRLRSRKEERGHGLGLSLIREVVHRHGGSLELRPEPGRFVANVAIPLQEKHDCE